MNGPVITECVSPENLLKEPTIPSILMLSNGEVVQGQGGSGNGGSPPACSRTTKRSVRVIPAVPAVPLPKPNRNHQKRHQE